MKKKYIEPEVEIIDVGEGNVILASYEGDDVLLPWGDDVGLPWY